MHENEDRVGAGSGFTRIEFDMPSGTFIIFSGETTVFAGAHVSLSARQKKGVVRLDTSGPWEAHSGYEGPEPIMKGGFSIQKREKWGRIIFAAGPAEGGAVVLSVGLIWEIEDEPPAVEAIMPMRVPAGGVWPGRESSKKWRAYVHGWQCWTPTGVVKGSRPGDFLLPLFLPKRLKSMLVNPSTPVTSERGRFDSEWFSAVADTGAGDSAVLGFTGVKRALSRVTVVIGRKPEASEIETFAVFDGVRPEPGIVMWSEPLAVIPGDLSTANLETYVGLVARAQGVETIREAPSGWCSWYQFFTDISQEKVLANLETLDDDYGKLGVDLVQIDDGYSPAIGDWLEVNERFSDGMAPLAAEISRRGKNPGIWVAPFTVTRGSRVFKEKKEWLQRDRKGKVKLAGISPDWGGRFYGLDVTNPEVLDWLREVFETLAGYGYRFFKLDFMACGALDGKRHDDSVTRAQAVRRALEVIREAVGSDAIIMAAGGPVMLGVGILDAQRVSGDVAPFWRTSYQTALRDRATPGVRNSLMNTMTRAFMSGRLFDGDPDCLLTRTSDTKLTDAERRTLASAIAVLGGSFMLSDDMTNWGEEELALAAKCLPHARGLAYCPDLWLREVPQYLASRMTDPGGEYVMAMAVNWFKKESDMSFHLRELGLEEGRWHACEFWSGQYLGELTDEAQMPGIEPHGCGLLRLTKAEDRPRLIGSNINLSQGAAELTAMEATESGVMMTVESPVRCAAELTLCLPGAGEVTARVADGPDVEVQVERLTTSVYRLKLGLEGAARIVLDYGKPD